MSYSLDYSGQRIAAEASADARAGFIRRTYGHLAGALLAFTILETLLIQLTPADLMLGLLSSQASRIILLIGFIGVSWLANYWALSGASPGLQYAGLSLYVVAEAIFFLPLMFIATKVDVDIIPKAGVMTLAIVAGLTFTVFFTRQDFSFLRPILSIGFCLAFAFVLASWLFGFNVGNWFAFAMVALASASILYSTSNVLHRYRTDQHVAASLSLFASVVLLFWYIVQILLMSRRN
jgi:FtsH-binding integral membrane protein